MNSSKLKKKHRNVVTLRCRKISSTSNKSQVSFHATPAGIRHRVSALSKNNKALAKNNRALASANQSLLCELSSKQKLLDEYSGYLNNMMLARFKITEVYSTVKTFFDEILLLLKVDNPSGLNVAVPTRTTRNLKNKMEKLVETTKEVTEAMSVDEVILESANEMDVNCTSEEFSEKLLGERRKKSYCNMDKNDAVTQLASTKSTDEIDKNAVNICDLNNTNNLKDAPECLPDKENTTSIQPSETNNELESLSTVSCDEDSEDAIKIRADKQVFPKNLSSILNEVSETPRLSTSLKLFIDSEATSEHNSHFLDENCISSEGSISKTLEKPSDGLSAVKQVRSKIPKIQVMSSESKIKTNSSGILSGKKGTTKRKYVKKDTEELDSDSNRRKTFVIKDTKHVSNSELSVVLNRDLLDATNISGETITNIGMESGKNICSRKTFVVKPSDIQENIQNSPCDRRKTFVKKCDVKSAFIKNKRGTVTLSEHVPTVFKVNEDCTDQSENLNVVNEQLVKDKNDINMFTDNTASEKGTSDATVDTSELVNPISIEDYEKIHCDKNSLPDVNIPAKNHSEELQQDNVCLLLPTKSNNSNSEDKNSKVEELNEKISCEFKDLQNIDAMGDDIEVLNSVICGDDPKGTDIFLKDKIEDLVKSNNIHGTRPHRHVSYKFQFESSDSECELIPDSDPCFAMEVLPIKKTPIRRCISKSKTKKVFVFDAHKRKSVTSKKSNGSKQKIFENVSKRSKASCQSNIDSVGNVGSENQSDGDIKNIENQKTIKVKEIAASVVRDQMCKTSSIQKADITNNEKGLMQNPTAEEIVKDRITKKYKGVNSGVKDDVTSAINEKNFIDDKIDILYSTEISHDNSQTVMSEKVLQEEEQSDCPNPQEKDLNRKCDTVDALCTSIKSSSNKENKKASKCKVGNKKRISIIDNAVDDIISKPKRSKKKNSEKKICFQEKEISSQDTENCSSNLIQQGISDGKLKKRVKKQKIKVKSNLPCNETDKNTFLVHAEVHSPPLFLNKPETNIMNKENLQLSVVLNDVFESGTQVFHEGRLFSLKTPFLSNSSNIPLPEEEDKNCKSTICTTSDDEEVPTRRTRRKVQNYKEPLLNKKLRR